jgi:hypothetical protein
MLPIQTPDTNLTLTLPGGDESNNLPVEVARDEAQRPVFLSEWGMTPEERQAIADGGFIRIALWGDAHPPISVGVADELHRPLGLDGKVMT